MLNPTCILVVEDDDSIRRLCVRILRSLGMHALEAANGAQALAQLQAEPSISAVILDVNLPDIGGPELAEWIRGQRTGLPIIYFTGSTAQAVDNADGLHPDTYLLPKPFTKERLLEVLQAALKTSDPRAT